MNIRDSLSHGSFLRIFLQSKKWSPAFLTTLVGESIKSSAGQLLGPSKTLEKDVFIGKIKT
jgi:hypothetical protein